MADLAAGYNVIQKVGDGARSRVFQVVNPTTGQVFALKLVTRERHEDTRFLVQAITEYQVSSNLDHPNLRKAHDLKKIRKFLRLSEVQVIMEYVDGVSLDKRRPEKIDESVDLFLKVAEGLLAMHEARFLHTDVKPNNILLSLDGKVKLIDFGQSCPIGFRKRRIQGTPDYIAPEQVDRRSLTQRTDVFNLGATLYWALTGQAYPTMIAKKGRGVSRTSGRRRQVPTPQELNAEIPSALSRLVMESCAHNEGRRPRDMREVIGRLEMVHHVLTKRRRAGHDMSTPAQPGHSRERAMPSPNAHSTPGASGTGPDGIPEKSRRSAPGNSNPDAGGRP